MPKIEVSVHDGLKTISVIEGRIDISNLPVSLFAKIIEVEQLMEQITGFRYHINIVEE